MKFDAISYSPSLPFRGEPGVGEFETDIYCLRFDRAITLHLKAPYLKRLLGRVPENQYQMRRWHFYTAHLNCLYLLLDCHVLKDLKVGYFQLEEVTRRNANVVSQYGISIAPQSHHQTVVTEDGLHVPSGTLESVNRDYAALTNDFDHIHVLSELTKSLSAYKSGDFTTSFVLAWFLLERFIESAWTSYLQSQDRDLSGGRKRMNAQRRAVFANPNAYPVSVKLQILELSGALSFDHFSELDTLRDRRNSIIHSRRRSGISNDDDSCKRALELIERFIKSVYGLPLALNRGYSYIMAFDRETTDQPAGNGTT